MKNFDIHYQMRKLQQKNAKQEVKVYTPEERQTLAEQRGIKATPPTAEEQAASLMKVDVVTFRSVLAQYKRELGHE